MNSDDQPKNPQDTQQLAQATMRIDITPAMLDQLQQAPIPAPADSSRPRIRVPASSPYHRPGPAAPVPHAPPTIRIRTASSQFGDDNFQLLLQNIYDAVFISDIQGTIESANVRAEHFFLSDAASLRKTNVFDWICIEDRAILSAISDSLRDNRFVLLQAICRRTDGTFFPAEIAASRIPIGGKPHLSFFIRDNTIRKEQEERLKTGVNALQNAGSGIAVTDLSGALVGYINPSMLQLLALSAEDAPSKTLADFLCDPALMPPLLESLQNAESWAGELEMKRADGTPFTAQAALAPNLNPDGAMTGVVVSLLDITSQRQAQRQLEAYARELRQKNDEMEADLKMARDLQYAFLPAAYPDVSGPAGSLSFAHIYHPSGLVGGDFFSVVPVTPSSVLVFMADVMGHGARAALVVATLRGLSEQFAKSAVSPAVFMERLNTAYARIFSQNGEIMFATAAALLFDLSGPAPSLSYANAGHPLPLLLRPDAPPSEITPDPSALGPALGLFENAAYTDVSIPLPPASRIVLYTDGLTECRRPDQEEFGEARLLSSLSGAFSQPPHAMLEAAVDSAVAFSGSSAFEDDICTLAIQVSPPGANPSGS